MIAAAIESDEADVRRMAAKLPLRVAVAPPEAARLFGDLSAVPTLFIFDGAGLRAATFYGAPPTLHAEAERLVGSLLRGVPPGP